MKLPGVSFTVDRMIRCRVSAPMRRNERMQAIRSAGDIVQNIIVRYCESRRVGGKGKRVTGDLFVSGGAVECR